MIDSEVSTGSPAPHSVASLYDRYTSTSMLTPDVDPKSALHWSEGYFKAHYRLLLPKDKTARILEVGCGYGRYLHALAGMGYSDCYGIDLSAEQISYAREKLHLNNVEQCNALAWLTARQDGYDCILALDVLEHLPTDDLLAMGGCIRAALKPGGIVIFQVPNAMSPLNPIIYGDLTHVRAFTPQSMQQLMLHVNLEPVAYCEIPPHVHGFKSLLQRMLFSGILRPMLGVFVTALHGRVMGGGIFSSNFIAVAKRRPHDPGD